MKKILLLLIFALLTGCAAQQQAQQHSFVFQEKTAVDQGTGLVWARNANLPERPILWKADDNVYAFIQKMNSDNYAGYADWRVPTKGEIEELIAYAKGMGFQADQMETWPFRKLKDLGFVDVRDYDYWTSTRFSPEEMWVADLGRGGIAAKSDQKPFCLWPVRGGDGK